MASPQSDRKNGLGHDSLSASSISPSASACRLGSFYDDMMFVTSTQYNVGLGQYVWIDKGCTDSDADQKGQR